MNNVTTSIKDGILTLTVDLNAQATESASGKSQVIASSRGNQPVAPGSNINFGLNVYHKTGETKLVPVDTPK